MTSLALAIALAFAGPDPAAPAPAMPAWWGGRIVTTGDLHVGLRPAIYVDNEGEGGRLEVGVGATLQITTNRF